MPSATGTLPPFQRIWPPISLGNAEKKDCEYCILPSQAFFHRKRGSSSDGRGEFTSPSQLMSYSDIYSSSIRLALFTLNACLRGVVGSMPTSSNRLFCCVVLASLMSGMLQLHAEDLFWPRSGHSAIHEKAVAFLSRRGVPEGCHVSAQSMLELHCSSVIICSEVCVMRSNFCAIKVQNDPWKPQ